MADAMIIRPFFSAQGLLPPSTFLEDLFTITAPTFQNLAGGTLTPSMSTLKYVPAAAVPANFGWDIGSEKSTILMLLHLQRFRSNDIIMFFTDTLPAAGEIPDGSYLVDTQGGTYVLYKRAGGVFTPLVTVNTIDNGTPTLDSGLSLYYDDATDRLVVFIRTSPECWFPIIDTTDASFTTMRYVGIRFNGGNTCFSNTPLAVYTN